MRIQSLDALRGIAILGILIMNIYFHGIFSLGYVPFAQSPLSDTVIDIFNAIFADGRFRTLFCILFGAGLAIQIQSCEKRGIDFKSFLKSRLNWLLIFGFIHGVFIFGGDILLLYSVCALAILNKLTIDTQALFKKAVKWLIIGAVLNVIFAALVIYFGTIEPAQTREGSEFLEGYNHWVGHYGYQVIVQSSFVAFLVLLSPLWVFWQVSGLMLLGMYLYRTGFFERGLSKKAFYPVLIAGVVLTLIDVLLRLTVLPIASETGTLIASLSAIFVALLYAHGVIKLAQSKSKLIAIFSAPGRMAFTLYIMQSVVLAIALRWVYPEFHLTATMSDYLVVAGGVIIVQMLFAHLYFKFFSQGPLEWLWRSAYQKTFASKQAKLDDQQASA